MNETTTTQQLSINEHRDGHPRHVFLNGEPIGYLITVGDGWQFMAHDLTGNQWGTESNVFAAAALLAVRTAQ
jgi:hypothetical protein